MRRVPITSTVGVEAILTSATVDTTVEGFPTPSLPKHFVKPYYAATKETHKLLTENAACVEFNLGRGQNGYLGLILLTKKYARVSGTACVFPSDPVQTAHVPACTAPTEEKRVLSEHTKQIRMYDEYRNVDTALKNQLIAVSDDPYLSTLKNGYTGYATRSTMDLITHFYKNYASIYPLEMVANDEILRASYNSEEPL